jgi:hypothetical protein
METPATIHLPVGNRALHGRIQEIVQADRDGVEPAQPLHAMPERTAENAWLKPARYIAPLRIRKPRHVP